MANGDLAKTKGSYKLTAHFKKKATAADKPKKTPKKKGCSMKEKEKEAEISYSSSLIVMVAERHVPVRPEESRGRQGPCEDQGLIQSQGPLQEEGRRRQQAQEGPQEEGMIHEGEGEGGGDLLLLLLDDDGG